MDYRKLFRRCGEDVQIHPDVEIEHPELWEVGDHVTLSKGVYAKGGPAEVRIGSHVTVEPYVFITGKGRLTIADHVGIFFSNYLSIGGNFIEIGPHTHFAPACSLYGGGGLKVGSHCAFSTHTVLATIWQHWRDTERPIVTYPAAKGPITIEDDCWVAANAVVCGDVTIRTGCVIGANAVVTKDTEPYGFYVGIPATLKEKRKKA